MSRLVPRLLAVAGLAGLGVGVAAGPASAHVEVEAPGATQGGTAVISFLVPTESDAASTVELKVQLPPAQPLASVVVKPHPGWTYKITTAKLATPIKTDDGETVSAAASVIDWRAASGSSGIKPGEFDEFQIQAGPLPKTPTMTFKAIQSYSDGTQVAWIEESAPGSQTEPEHPAPTIALAAPGAARSGSAGSGPGSGVTATAAPAPAAQGASSGGASSGGASTGSVVGAYIVGALGLLVGIGGLAVAASARRRPATVEGRHSVRTGVE